LYHFPAPFSHFLPLKWSTLGRGDNTSFEVRVKQLDAPFSYVYSVSRYAGKKSQVIALIVLLAMGCLHGKKGVTPKMDKSIGTR
jgi:hypothetical protein